jgi:hypothetical protein
MNTKIENRNLSRSTRASSKIKQEHEKLQAQNRELETMNKALSMHVEAFNALKNSEVTEAVTFTSVDSNSVSRININEDNSHVIREAMRHPKQKIFYRQEVKEFLPCGVDFKVTVRLGASPESILDNLHQIIQSINLQNLLVRFLSCGPTYVIFNPNNSDYGYDYGATVDVIKA